MRNNRVIFFILIGGTVSISIREHVQKVNIGNCVHRSGDVSNRDETTMDVWHQGEQSSAYAWASTVSKAV